MVFMTYWLVGPPSLDDDDRPADTLSQQVATVSERPDIQEVSGRITTEIL
jgi:hypothetical protein